MSEEQRKAPNIKPDYATMHNIYNAPRRRPWHAGFLMVAMIGLVWLTAWLLMVADVPAWTRAPIVITATLLGCVAFVCAMFAFMGD